MVLDHEVYCPSLSGGRRLRESIPNVRSGGGKTLTAMGRDPSDF
jgi:hypothetical protein